MKKILSLVLVLSMVLGSFGFAFAADTANDMTAGEMLQAMGLLEGDNGDLMLDKDLKRQDMMVMLSRLLGEEEEAEAYPIASKFPDVRGDYYKAIVGWAEHNGLTTDGMGDGTFGFDGKLELRHTITFLLRALGYDSEYAWENNATLAVELGWVAEGLDLKATTNRGVMAQLVVNALYTPMFESEVTLGTNLGYEGFEVVEEELEVVSVNATAANEIKVTFNKAVEEDLTFQVKKGTAVITVKAAEWNEAKTEATLVKTSSNFAAGTDYTVTVKGTDLELSANLSITAQRVASIEILGQDIIKSAAGDSATFNYVVKDQYGKDITRYTSLNHSVSVGTLSFDAIRGTATVTYDFATDILTKQVIVVLVDSNTGVNTNATLNVSNAAKVQNVEFGEVKLPTGVTRLQKHSTNSTMPVTVTDQYGNAIKNTVILGNAIDLLSSSTEVTFAFSTDADNNPIITMNTNSLTSARTVLLTAVVKADGKTYTKTFDIAMPAQPRNVVLGAIEAEVVAEGDTRVVLPITVYDQFGVELTKDQMVTAKLAIEGMISVPSVAIDAGIENDRNSKYYGQYTFRANAEGTGMFVSTSTQGVSTSVVTVKAPRVLTDVVAPSTVNLMQGASADVEFTFVDQYGRTITTVADTANMKYFVTLTKVSGSDNAVVAPAQTATFAAVAESEAQLAELTLNAARDLTGTYRLTVNLVKGTVTTGALTVAPADVLSSASVNVNVVKNNVTGLTYSIKEIATLAGNTDYAVSHVQARAITVVAKDAAGVEYVINPADIISVTASNSRVVVDKATMKVAGQDIQTAAIANKDWADKTSTITVKLNTLDGIKTVTTEVKVSPFAPSPTEFRIVTADLGAATRTLTSATVNKLTYVVADKATAQAGVAFHIIAKDQYGVWTNYDETNATIVVNSTNLALADAFEFTADNELSLKADDTASTPNVEYSTGLTAARDIKATVMVDDLAVEIIINVTTN